MDGFVPFEELVPSWKGGISKRIKEVEAFSKETETILVNLTKLIQRNFDQINNNQATFNKLQKSLKDTNATYKSGQKEIENFAKQVKGLKEEQDDLKKTNEELADVQELYTKSVVELKEEAKELQQVYNETVTAQDKNSESAQKLAERIRLVKATAKELTDETKRLNNEFSATEGSYNALVAKNKQLRDQLKNIPGAMDETSQAYKENIIQIRALQGEVELNNTKLKEFDKALGDNFREVGNYKEQFKSAIEESQGFAEQTGLTAIAQDKLNEVMGPSVVLLQKLQKQFIKTDKGARKATKGAKGFNTVLRVIGKAGIIAILTALAAALASVFSFFTKSIEGGNKFELIISRISATISVFVGRLIKSGSAILKFGKAIGTFLENPYRNYKKSSDLFKQANQELAGAFAGMGKEIDEQVERYKQITEAQQDFRKSTRTLELSIAELNKSAAKQTEIAGDATRSFKETEGAAEKARVAIEERNKLSVKLAQEELDIINKKVEAEKAVGQLSNELLDEQLEAKKKLIEAQTEQLTTELANERERRQLFQDRKERDLDIIKDFFEVQFTNNERLVTSDKLVLEERRKNFKDLKALSNESFAAQTGVLDDLSSVQIDYNELLSLNSIELNKRIRSLEQSEIVEGRTLEVIKDRLALLGDLEELEKELTEAEKQRTKSREEANTRLLEFELQSAEARAQIELDLAEQLNKGLATRFEALKTLKEAQIDIENLRFNEQKAILEAEILDQVEKNTRIELLEKEHQKNLSEINKQALNGRLEQTQDFLQKIGSTFTETSQLAFDFASALTDRKQEEREKELEKLEEQQEFELENAADNAEAQAAIEETFAKRKEEIEKKIIEAERKRAIFQKAISVGQIAIDTAAAAVAAIRNGGGLPFALPALIATLAAGAAQSAVVLAQPIPSFADGGTTPGGLIRAGEEGPELGFTKEGKVKIFPKDGLYDEPQGTQILTNKITERILNSRGQDKIENENIINSLSRGKAELLKNDIEKNIIIAKAATPEKIDYQKMSSAFAKKLPTMTNTYIGKDGSFSTVQVMKNGSKVKLSEGNINAKLINDVGQIKNILKKNGIR